MGEKEVAMLSWNKAMIDEFHAKDGKGVGDFGDRLVLLTTTGARSGEERTTPVMYHRDGERYIVVASKAGAPDNPGWYHNLKAHPVARVEVGMASGTETFEVRAHEAEGEERERIWAERIAIAPGFQDYQRKTSRRIPVMILERIG
ncbi:MAG: nitroreductase family deazaflavin-dependent oxidoreductase [Candidatus Dormiibacterota bacterium]